MPVLILLDNSFSMYQSIKLADGSTMSRFNLALSGVKHFLDHHSTNNKLDPSALLVFANTCHIVCNLTRDYDVLLQSLKTIQLSDRTNLIEGLSCIQKWVTEDWGADFEYNILILTDGNSSVQSSFLNKKFNFTDMNDQLISDKWPIPFAFSCKIHIVCITTSEDIAFQRSVSFYKKIISRNTPNEPEIEVNTHYKGGQIYVPTSTILSNKDIEGIFNKINEFYFKPCIARISCGELSSNVSLFPNLKDQDEDNKENGTIPIEICGFFDFEELTNAPSYSKHLILPISETTDKLKQMLSFINLRNDINDEEYESMFSEPGKQPSFAVLLHGSCKISNMIALVQIGLKSNQYGFLYSKTDNKKKSNLILSTLEPGHTSVLWISNFHNLSFNNEGVSKSTAVKKSSNIMVWVDQDSIQSDIQKILRYARKLPEKNEILLSEIRKVKRAAIAFDFNELIDNLILMLEREISQLPTNCHVEAASYIANIIKELKHSSV